MPREEDVQALQDPAIIEDQAWFQVFSSPRNWTGRTYLNLRAAGYPVRVSASVPERGRVVVYVNDARALLKDWRSRRGRTLIVSRADCEPVFYADFEIVQNGYFANDRRTFSIPYWPQRGLLPRDPDRGASIRTVAFKGFYGNFQHSFYEQAWTDALAQRGLRFDADDGRDRASVDRLTAYTPTRWHDYRDVDLVVAVRPNVERRYLDKPPSKLVNAWHAGVPCLLGPEHAYRELRRSELDYIEVHSAMEAIAAIDRLRADPGLYRAMVEHGRERARDFTVQRLTERWAEVLFDRIPAQMRRPSTRLRAATPMRLKGWCNFLSSREYGGFGKRRALHAARAGFLPTT